MSASTLGRLIALIITVGVAAIAHAQDVVIPANTEVVVITGQAIDSSKADLSHQYPAKLDEALVVNGREVAPKGATAALMVDTASGAGVAGRAALSLRLAWVTVNGERLPVTSGEVTSESNSQKGKTIKGAAIGTAAGMALGGLLRGKKGVLGGGAAGGAVGAGAAVLSGQKVSVPDETRLTFTLAQDVVRQPAQAAAASSSGGTVAPPTATRAPVTVASSNNVRFEFGSAVVDGDALTVVVYATNLGVDRQLFAGDYGRPIPLIDEAGSTFHPTEVHLGNQGASSALVNGVRMPITLLYKQMPTVGGKLISSMIRRLTINLLLRQGQGTDQHGSIELQFLPIQDRQAVETAAASAPRAAAASTAGTIATPASVAAPAPSAVPAAPAQSPVTVASSNNLRFEFDSAIADRDTLTVVAYATNLGLDRHMWTGDYGRPVTLIDESGNTYHPAEVHLGNQGTDSAVVNGVRMPITLLFKQMPTMGGKMTASSIRRLTFNILLRQGQSPQQSGAVEFQFLPIKKD